MATFTTGYGERRVVGVGESLYVGVTEVSSDLITWSSSDQTVLGVIKTGYSWSAEGRAAGEVEIEARWASGSCVERLHVVDPQAVIGLELDALYRSSITPPRFGFELASLGEHRYRRDVSASPAAEWWTSDPTIARFEERAVLSVLRDGDVTAFARFQGLVVSRQLVSGHGTIATLSEGLRAPQHAFVGLWFRLSNGIFPRPVGQNALLEDLKYSSQPRGLVEAKPDADGTLIRVTQPGELIVVTELGQLRSESRVMGIAAKLTLSEITIPPCRVLGFIPAPTVGMDLEFRASLLADDRPVNEPGNLVWESSAPEVVTISNTGHGKGMSVGEAVVSVSCPQLGLRRELEVRVSEPVEVSWY